MMGNAGHHRPTRESALQEMHSEQHIPHRNVNHLSSSSTSLREDWRSSQQTERERSERRSSANMQNSTTIPSRAYDMNGGRKERRKVQECSISNTSQPYELTHRQNSQAERLNELDV